MTKQNGFNIGKTMAHLHQVFRYIWQVSVILLLISYIIGLGCIPGKISLGFSMAGIAVLVVMLALSGKTLLRKILHDRSNPVFTPGMILLWAATAYSKGDPFAGIVILFLVFVILEISEQLLLKYSHRNK